MKNIIIVILMAIALVSNAQVKWSIKGGLNLANAEYSYYNGQRMDTKNNNTWGFGSLIDIPVKWVIIQTGLNYQNKGFRVDEVEIDDFSGDVYTTKTSINYDFVELPLTIGKKFPLTENLSLQVNVGIWTAVALSGKSNQQYLINGQQVYQENHTFEFGDSEDLSRMDYGITMGANLNYKGVLLGTTYNPSRYNIYKDDFATIYNKLTQIYIGYQF